MRCASKNGARTWQCPNEALDGATRCDSCRSAAADVRKQARERAKAERNAFFAKHATRTPPAIAPPESERAPKLEVGRRYGATTVVRDIDNRSVRGLCHHCNNEYDCDRRRIHLGTAARHGCGCLKLPMRGRVPGPLPKFVGASSRKETSL